MSTHDRQERMREWRRMADERQRQIEALFGRSIPFRPGTPRTQLPTTAELPPNDADIDGRNSVRAAQSVDMDAIARLAQSKSDANWFEIAQAALPDFPPALGPKSRVWVSDKGSLYHRYSDCETMWKGKIEAEKEGMQVHGVSSMTVAEAQTEPGYWRKPHTPCKTCI